MSMTGASDVGGFRELTISVFDIDRLGRVLERVGGYGREALAPAPPAQLAFWGLPPHARAEQALFRAPGEDRGFLRLVRFDNAGPQQPMRPAQHTWDTGGIFDIDVYSDDLDRLYAEFQREGWTALGPPVDYRWGGFDAREVLMLGPDGVVIGVIKAYGKVLIELAPYRHMSRAFNSGQIVRDYDAALRFYLDGLGWRTLVDTVVEGVEEPGRNVLGIPRPLATTTRRRVAIVHPEGLNDGSIELIEMRELDGEDYAELCVAPNIGFLSYRLPVRDAAAYRDAVASRGVAIWHEPTEIEIAPYGACRCFAVRSPDGALIEFFEALRPAA